MVPHTNTSPLVRGIRGAEENMEHVLGVNSVPTACKPPASTVDGVELNRVQCRRDGMGAKHGRAKHVPCMLVSP